jgi:hypothetical protein
MSEMKTVYFDPNGGALTAKAVFLGRLVANYSIFLRQKDSNAQTTLLAGDNTNPEDDSTPLPTPALTNDGRRVVLETGFYGPDHGQYPGYEIRLEIYQDDQLIGCDNDTGPLNGKGQYSLIFIKLLPQ